MQNLEFFDLVDKSKFGQGEWQIEFDKAQWTDEKTRLPCLIVRNPAGALCGYVGVPSSHRFFEKNYDDCDVNVHVGLTFSEKCMPHEMSEPKVCHLVEDDEDDNIWWLGFDCSHSGDLSPAYRFSKSETYRNISYVKNEIADLAAQLANI